MGTDADAGDAAGRSSVRSYRDLIVWQKAMDLAVLCYEHTKAFPPDERFGLTSQIRRAAASVPANVAEGHGRRSRREFLQFLRIARGSLMELETHIILSARLGLIQDDIYGQLLAGADEVSRMVAGLQRSLSASAAP